MLQEATKLSLQASKEIEKELFREDGGLWRYKREKAVFFKSNVYIFMRKHT